MNEIVWKLTPKNESANYIDLVVKVANNEDVNLSDYEIRQVEDVILSFKDQIIGYLLEHGFNSLVEGDLLLEHIVARGTPDNKIIPILIKYLDKIEIDSELIIVDPYFFAKPKNPNYITLLDQVLDKYINTICDLVIITSTHSIDLMIKNGIELALKRKNPALNIIHQQNNNYHDRYWISGARQKGVVIGTSLNSLGNKVALLDRLNTTDVRSIVSELIDDSLI